MILLNLLIISLITSCEKDKNLLNINAEIIDFNPDKCSCCWGWTIKIGTDTIKSDSEIIGETIGYEIIKPIKVNIELAEIEKRCSNLGFANLAYVRDYYKIEKIKTYE